MDNKIPLPEMLAQLRLDLAQAQAEGEGSSLKFQIEDIELELQLVATQKADGGGGVKFWVINADAKYEGSQALTQKLKLKLKLAGKDGKSPLISQQFRASRK
ncbi:MAG: trypco2 family protein [Methylococcaceae bacterium]